MLKIVGKDKTQNPTKIEIVDWLTKTPNARNSETGIEEIYRGATVFFLCKNRVFTFCIFLVRSGLRENNAGD
jgi:hypothetical protein